MLKTLLEERLELAAHREMRAIPAYALVIGKDGLKIKEVEPGEGKTNTSGSRFIGTKVTMKRRGPRPSSISTCIMPGKK